MLTHGKVLLLLLLSSDAYDEDHEKVIQASACLVIFISFLLPTSSYCSNSLTEFIFNIS